MLRKSFNPWAGMAVVMLVAGLASGAAANGKTVVKARGEITKIDQDKGCFEMLVKEKDREARTEKFQAEEGVPIMKEGKEISLEDVSVGDKVEVDYSVAVVEGITKKTLMGIIILPEEE